MTEIDVIQKENVQNLNIGEVISELSPTQNTPLAPLRMSQPLKTHANVLCDVTNFTYAPMHVENPSQTLLAQHAPKKNPLGRSVLVIWLLILVSYHARKFRFRTRIRKTFR